MHKGGFPYFLWQEHEHGDWKTYSLAEIRALNKAAAKDQKKVTLPCSDPTQKTTICFERMFSKSKTGNDEKKVRCLILNNKSVYAVWSRTESNGHNFVSYSPRMTYFLETMFQKDVPKVDFHYKTEYEVDFLNRTITDKDMGVVYNIHREEIDFVDTKWNQKDLKKHVINIFESERLMEAIITSSVDRIKNLLFNMPISHTEIPSSFSPHIPNEDLIAILEKENETPKEKLVTADPCFSLCQNYEECHVVSEKDCIFSATLILTSLEENINKFCILQLLKFKNRKKYVIWGRRGRVGYDGNGEMSEIFSNLQDAKKEFEELFYEKTQNHWSERLNFQRKPKRYHYIRTYFNAGNIEDTFNSSLEYMQSNMNKAMQELLSLIFCGANLGLAVKKWLLESVSAKVGIPSIKQLLEAFTALNDVTNLLTLKNKGKELIEACNNYYMRMPHNSKYDAPKMLVSADVIDEEVLMLQTLVYISVNTASTPIENPIDLYFRRFQWNIAHLDHGCKEFIVLQESLTGLQGPTHDYKMTLLDAFKWHKQSELDRFVDKGNKMLLWHGTQLSNFIGIIKHGLKLPPIEAPSTSSMFGRGLYFADVCSKSANYCFPTKMNDIGLLLLCEVSMGTPIDVLRAGDFSTLPKSFGGVIALGEYYPSDFMKSILAPEAVFPKGPLKRRINSDMVLKYNEYVVYNECQVKILYVLKVKFSVKKEQ